MYWMWLTLVTCHLYISRFVAYANFIEVFCIGMTELSLSKILKLLLVSIIERKVHIIKFNYPGVLVFLYVSEESLEICITYSNHAIFDLFYNTIIDKTKWLWKTMTNDVKVRQFLLIRCVTQKCLFECPCRQVFKDKLF